MPSLKVVPRERHTAPSLTPTSIFTFTSRAGFPSSGHVALHICLPKRPEADWANFWSHSPGSYRLLHAYKFSPLQQGSSCPVPTPPLSSKVTQASPPGDNALTGLGPRVPSLEPFPSPGWPLGQELVRPRQLLPGGRFCSWLQHHLQELGQSKESSV